MTKKRKRDVSSKRPSNVLTFDYRSDEGTCCLITRVVLTGVMFRCSQCDVLRPAVDFGLHMTVDGAVKNMEVCSSCRERDDSRQRRALEAVGVLEDVGRPGTTRVADRSGQGAARRETAEKKGAGQAKEKQKAKGHEKP